MRSAEVNAVEAQICNKVQENKGVKGVEREDSSAIMVHGQY